MVRLYVTPNDTLICRDYRVAYKHCIFEMARIYIRNQYELLKSQLDHLMRSAIKCYLSSEMDSTNFYVKSDYDYLVDKDQGGLFDLVHYYYHKDPSTQISDNEILIKLGQRLIRNYELYALDQIQKDLREKMYELDHDWDME